MRLQGVGVSSGIGMGTAYLVEEPVIDISKKEAAPNETARLSIAVDNLVDILNNRAASAGGEQAEILESHVMLLSDPVILADIESLVTGENCNSEYAVSKIFEEYAEVFRQSGNEVMMMRAGDMGDIKNNLIAVMNGFELPDLDAMPKSSILAANELTTSLAACINKSLVNGLVTNLGGPTSHMAIIARSMELPAVVGIDNIAHGSQLIVNGDTGEVIVDPTEAELAKYSELMEEIRRKKEALEKYKGMPSVTMDGRHMELFANIGLEADILKASGDDAEGVGLFRTEFLFMNRTNAPSEEEQLSVYKKAALTFGERPVIIRTLDIGGDKDVPYLGLEKEENPFLGWRAIRYCIDREELFATQLRAVLRASAFGSIKIMLPMIVDIRELRQVKALIKRLMEDLTAQDIAYDQDIPVGVMIETPAAAVLAGAFAKEADFFSIGTNDLTQYVMAVDRGNQKVAKLYSEYNPAVLRLIYNVAKEAACHNIPCGVCGEAGAKPLLTKFLVGCGINELSMTSASILEVRSIIRQMTYADTKAKIAESIEQLADIEDSLTMLRAL
jgi:phosphotransferase system enzyme I (PtsI)